MADIKLLDWQIINYHSPVRDLSHALYSSGSKDIFDDFEKYLKLYYDEFSSFVTQLGSDPDKLYPYAILKQEWIAYSKFGFMMGIMVNKNKLTYENDIMDFVDIVEGAATVENIKKQSYDKEEFERRFVDMALHIYNLGGL